MYAERVRQIMTDIDISKQAARSCGKDNNTITVKTVKHACICIECSFDRNVSRQSLLRGYESFAALFTQQTD